MWFGRGRRCMVSPDSLGTACPPSGRNSTYRPVQILEAGSLFHAVDANGKLVDLATEWKTDYQALLAGKSLTPIQHLEANAEAVFENTGLSKLSAAQQAIDREDAQREFDAIAAAMQIDYTKFAIDPSKPLDQHSYLTLEHTLQSDPLLKELAMQGHDLNNSGIERYDGYTNDFQNNVDNTTLYIGGGLNNNQKAIADFFDDNVLSHVPFPVVDHNGTLTQLNQNGAPENTLHQAIVALDDSMYLKVYTSADFSAHASKANAHYRSPAEDILAAEAKAPTPDGDIKTLFGDFIPNKITPTAHNCVADSSGLFHAVIDPNGSADDPNNRVDLAAEWWKA